jgi:hypothetical protein
VKNIDLGCGRGFVFGKDSWPEIEACIVAEFDAVKTERLGLLQKRGAVGRAVSMPACGEGEGGGRHGH